MKKYLLSIWSLALIIAVPIIVFLPPIFNKYNGILKEKKTYLNTSIESVYFEDVDNDGELERFETFKRSQSQGFSFHFFQSNGGMVDQINWPLKFNEKTKGLFFADFDNDKHKEVYTFSFNNDSLFLNWIQLTPVAGNFKSLFICKLNAYNDGLYDYQLGDIYCLDIDNDGKNELIFPVVGGYSITPRQIFRIDYEQDEILKSENTGCSNAFLQFEDLDNDGNIEIIADGQVSPIRKNYNLPLNTQAPYLKIFNADLSYFSPPVKFFEGIQSTTFTYVIEKQKSKELICTFISSSSECPPFVSYRMNIKGEKIDSLVYESNDRNRRKYLFKNDRNNFFTQISPSTFLEFNRNLKVLNERKFENKGDLQLLQCIDINSDKTTEYVFFSFLNKELLIFSDNMDWEQSIQLDEDDTNFGIKKSSDGEIILFTPENYYKINFSGNILYYLQIPLYAIIYSLSVLFIWLIQTVRIKQLNEKLELQNQIHELQLKTLRNQLDPHFIYNTFNTIASVIKQGRNEEAYDLFVQLSKMVRTYLDNSTRIYTTLENELNLIKDYLAIQKFRFREMFSYEIVTDEGINFQVEIPKMLIQIHVENALKHGIRASKKEGNLIIRVLNKTSDITIEIEDNGIGRKKSMEIKNEKTGIGLIAIEQFIQLNNKKKKSKIIQKIIDLADTSGAPAGTKVMLTIKNSN